METQDLTPFGGKKLAFTKSNGKTEEVWYMGWVDPNTTSLFEEIVEQDKSLADKAGITPDILRQCVQPEHAATIKQMDNFQITGTWKDEGKAFLWQFRDKVSDPKIFTTFYQKTGSCVGNGGGQAVRELSAVEVYRLGDPERVLIPFYLLPYGRSRYYAGMRGRGEGSFGSAFAKAITTDGILPADAEGLPSYSFDGGLTWGGSEEMKWSDGGAISQDWLTKSKVHLIKSAAAITTTDQAREALSNGYPFTIASNWGGNMKCTVQDGVLLNRRVTTWMHQMCCLGFWEHPQLGEIYYILNSWGTTVHGKCPSGAPEGGFWVKKADMANILSQKDSFAFSQFQGFPAQNFVWIV